MWKTRRANVGRPRRRRTAATPLVRDALLLRGGPDLRWGIAGVAAPFAVARTASLVANTILRSQLIDERVFRMFRSYAEVIGRTGAMTAALAVDRVPLIHLGVAAGPRLAVLLVGGTLVYLLLPTVAASRLVRDARNRLRRRVATA